MPIGCKKRDYQLCVKLTNLRLAKWFSLPISVFIWIIKTGLNTIIYILSRILSNYLYRPTSRPTCRILWYWSPTMSIVSGKRFFKIEVKGRKVEGGGGVFIQRKIKKNNDKVHKLFSLSTLKFVWSSIPNHSEGPWPYKTCICGATLFFFFI